MLKVLIGIEIIFVSLGCQFFQTIVLPPFIEGSSIPKLQDISGHLQLNWASQCFNLLPPYAPVPCDSPPLALPPHLSADSKTCRVHGSAIRVPLFQLKVGYWPLLVLQLQRNILSGSYLADMVCFFP